MCDFVFGCCLTLGLYDCWASDLCLSVCPSEKVMLAWGLSVCPSEKVMFGMGFVCLSV